MCQCCKWVEHVLLILIIVFALFVYGAVWSQWVIFVAAFILLIHKFVCTDKKCAPVKKAKVNKKKKK